MKFDETQSSVMMSNSLIDREPQLEERISAATDSIVIAALEFSNSDFVVGSLVGISVEPTITKIDVKIEKNLAFELLNAFLSSSLTCTGYQLELGESVIKIQKQFNVTSCKMLDIQLENKMSVIALDLSYVE